MKKSFETTIDYSSVENMKSFIETEIRNYTIVANKRISEGKLTKESANFKRTMLLSILKLLEKILKGETFLRMQMNLFDTQEFKNNTKSF